MKRALFIAFLMNFWPVTFTVSKFFNKAAISDLPIEIIEHILSFLSYDDLYNMMLVDKRFYAACSEIRSLHLVIDKNMLNDKFMVVSMKRFARPFYRLTIDIDDFCDGQLNDLLDILKNIGGKVHTLHLARSRAPRTDPTEFKQSILVSRLNAMPDLDKISFAERFPCNENFDDPFTTLNLLKLRIVYNCPDILGMKLHQMPQASIQFLKLNNYVTMSKIEEIIQTHRLTMKTVQLPVSLCRNPLPFCLLQLTKFSCYYLNGSWFRYNEYFKDIIEHQDELKILELRSNDTDSNCFSVNSELLNLICEKTSLEEISIGLFRDVKPSDVNQLSKLINLRKLVLDISDVNFQDNPKMLKAIANMKISSLKCLRLVGNIADMKAHTMHKTAVKLLFFINALTSNVGIKVRYHDGFVHLVETLDLIMKMNAKPKELGQREINLINEILKVLFNITVTEPTTVDKDDDQRLAIVLHDLLLYDAKAKEFTEEYHSNIVNLLTNIPISCMTELVPSNTDDESEIYENFNMHSINIFLRFLGLRLDKIFETSMAKNYEQLSPILTVMIKCVRCTSTIRRYVRMKILPPLRDVKKMPEEGTTLRNHLCKLLSYPSTQISDLVAELLFVLCKENVDRMIKYTGYGNAAGLFAKRGLLGGRACENQHQYSSDSEDSETEEYKKLLHGINPVIGCYEKPKKSPVKGMTEEQEEYEAEK